MGPRRVAKELTILAGFLAILSAAPRARAASEEDKAGARAAATQGEAAFNGKRWAEAVDLFTRAESLVHSPVHLLFKARALIQLGQLVKARETLNEITREQADKPTPALLKARDAASKELETLEPRLAAVAISVQGPGADKASVTMDGAKVPSALLGVSHPVDPGEHQFEATSAVSRSAVSKLSLKEGGTGSVTLKLEPIAGVPVAVAPAPGPTTAAVNAETSSGATTDTPNNGLRVGSYVALGVGAAGLVVGTVFGLSAKSKYKDANALCVGDPCDISTANASKREQLGKDGDSAKTASLIGFIVGGVGVATGATLFILSSKKSEPTQAGVHPYIGAGSLGLTGKF